MTKFPDNDKWIGRKISPWRQDVNEWEDPETHEVYPPTYSWTSIITDKRRSDGTYFYVKASCVGDKDKSLNETVAKLTIENAMVRFEEYADCECILDHPCKRHG